VGAAKSSASRPPEGRGDAIARADPALQEVYSRLLKAVGRFGPVREERGDRSVLLRSRGDFAASRFHVHVRITSPADIDAQLLGWLRDAYDLMA
jgi:hypothetical protein